MTKITYTYADGRTQINTGINQIRGISLNGSRPVKIDIIGKLSDERIYKEVIPALHTGSAIVTLNGDTIYERVIND